MTTHQDDKKPSRFYNSPILRGVAIVMALIMFWAIYTAFKAGKADRKLWLQSLIPIVFMVYGIYGNNAAERILGYFFVGLGSRRDDP